MRIYFQLDQDMRKLRAYLRRSAKITSVDITENNWDLPVDLLVKAGVLEHCPDDETQYCLK